MRLMLIPARRGFSSPLEGEVAAQRSEGGAAEGYWPRPCHDFGFAELTSTLTLPPSRGLHANRCQAAPQGRGK